MRNPIWGWKSFWANRDKLNITLAREKLPKEFHEEKNKWKNGKVRSRCCWFLIILKLLLLLYCLFFYRDSDWRRIVLCFRIGLLLFYQFIVGWTILSLPLGLSFGGGCHLYPVSSSLASALYFQSWLEFDPINYHLFKVEIEDQSQKLTRIHQPSLLMVETNDSGLTHSLVARIVLQLRPKSNRTLGQSTIW